MWGTFYIENAKITLPMKCLALFSVTIIKKTFLGGRIKYLKSLAHHCIPFNSLFSALNCTITYLFYMYSLVNKILFTPKRSTNI